MLRYTAEMRAYQDTTYANAYPSGNPLWDEYDKAFNSGMSLPPQPPEMPGTAYYRIMAAPQPIERPTLGETRPDRLIESGETLRGLEYAQHVQRWAQSDENWLLDYAGSWVHTEHGWKLLQLA